MTHGKIWTYNNGCRCDECRAAIAAYRRESRAQGECLDCGVRVYLRKRCPRHLAYAASTNRRRYHAKKAA